MSNVPDAFKSKSKMGGGGILNTNKETGASAWSYNENRFHPSAAGSKYDLRAMNQQQLANAQAKGGGILNTNAETGYDLWHQGGGYYVQQQPQMDYEKWRADQINNAKNKGGGILNTNVESEPWSYGGGSGGDQYASLNRMQAKANAFAKQNQNYYYKQPQTNTTTTTTTFKSGNPNSGFSQQKTTTTTTTTSYKSSSNVNPNVFNSQDYQNYSNMMNNNNQQNSNPYYKPQAQTQQQSYHNFSQQQSYMPTNNANNMEMDADVNRVETTEKFVTENGVRKKVTKIVKYMNNGEIKTEMFKTNA